MCLEEEDNWPSRDEVQTLASKFSSLMTRNHCSACNGYYGPAFGQPVCPTCHAFLYANVHDAEINLQLMSEERHGDESDSDRDSGNDEPNENVPEGSAAAEKQMKEPQEVAADSESYKSSNQNLEGKTERGWSPDHHHHEERNDCRHNQNHLAAAARAEPEPEPGNDRVPVSDLDLVHDFPPELMMAIFKYLDDISLYAVAHTCKRWFHIVVSQTTTEQWMMSTQCRWPLFQPMKLISDWFSVYSDLVESSFCLTCIYQMAEVIPADSVSPPFREKRLGHDLRGLVGDSPEGIKAQPLDSSYYHWQASITGPVGSPYEGGSFYLYLKVPFTYPFDPPEVRFLTRIFHPNVSRHGDIGIDSIQQHNWVSGLTIPKVLISIQSLLTDPYTDVCMEPEIGRMYVERRKLFDSIAINWTWKYAMWDVLPSKRRHLE